VVLRLSLSFK